MDADVVESRTRFELLAGLVVQADDHVDARLALLEETRRALEGPEAPGPDARRGLADRIERWRYQLLNHWGTRLPSVHAELTRQLDRLGVAVRSGKARSPRGLRQALANAREHSLDPDVAACLDPGRPIEEVEQAAREVTARHFPALNGGRGGVGRAMVLYAPLYLSNYCINHCLYCAFRYPNPLRRTQLDADQALAEADALARRGFRHILVVAGEHPRMISSGYLIGIVEKLVSRGFSIAVEIAPQATGEYQALRAAGACGVTLYQETYDEVRYAEYHPKGTKTWYDWRLEGPERAAEAGIPRLGLGVLLGLAEPRAEFTALLAHGRYLAERFPGLRLAFSLPRIHEAPDGFQPPYLIEDETFIRLYCALRLAFPGAHLVLSTREAADLRDRLARCCITQMSAGSSTAPGGYAVVDGSGTGDQEQFPVCDSRTVGEVASRLCHAGFEIRWDFEPIAPAPGPGS